MDKLEELLRECISQLEYINFKADEDILVGWYNVTEENRKIVEKIKTFLSSKKQKKSACPHELVHCSECGEEMVLKSKEEKKFECKHFYIRTRMRGRPVLYCTKCGDIKE